MAHPEEASVLKVYADTTLFHLLVGSNETVDAFNWLHLTDLHWGLREQEHLWPTIRSEFFDDLRKIYPHTRPWHAVLFTGDFANYAAWQAKRSHCPPEQIINTGLLPGDFSTTFTTEGQHKVGVVGLNTAFLQLGDEIQQGHLACHQRQFNCACEPDGPQWCKQHDVCLLMTHHSPRWLDDHSRENVYPDINKPGRFAVHLFGHMHEQMLSTYSQKGGPSRGWAQACSLFGMEHYGDQKKEDRRHGYSVGTLRFRDGSIELRHWPRRARHDPVNGWWFDRDPDCILDKDGGTKAEIISQNADPSDSPAELVEEPIEQVTARALGNYHAAAQQEWDERWSGVIGEE